MRLKSMDGPLSVHNNGNNDILNSPKRINTIQNSNYTTSQLINSQQTGYQVLSNKTSSTEDDNIILRSNVEDLNTLNNVNNSAIPQDNNVVQWCNPAQEIIKRELTNNVNNRNHQLLNINNTLAAQLRTSGAPPRHNNTTTSLSCDSSPDDSFLDFEEAQQSGSSAETSPQDEERGFDPSDSESSEEGNLKLPEPIVQRRGIVNPNYPGFQHLAHTLDYTIKASSDDTDFTDDDYECDLQAEANTINNNNNNDPETDEIDHIDSVNRLDSVENIQKVFYDKPVFNISQDELINQNICDSETSNSNTSDEDTEIHVDLNIKQEEKSLTQSHTHENIVGDFGKEVQQELGKISQSNEFDNLLEKPYELPPLERALIQELKEAVEKLSVIADWQPSATQYNIEPNIDEPFNKLSPTQPQPEILEDQTNITMEVAEKITDAFLSSAQEPISLIKDLDLIPTKRDSNRELEEIECQIKKIKSDTKRFDDQLEKFSKENITKSYKEKEDDSSVKRKKDTMDFYVKKRRDYNQQFGSLITFPRRELNQRTRTDSVNRRALPMARDKKRSNPEVLGGFDVYNIETAMPKIDLEAIETHLRAAREEERRRRTDREEIRRRLAMGSEDDYYTDRPGRKPSLQARLQSGMNLQICFMNETVSDTESPTSDSESPVTNPKQPKTSPKNGNIINKVTTVEPPTAPVRPATLSLGQPLLQPVKEPMTETDFFARQARLQTEARMALAQAKERARMQMEIERQHQKKSPITEMVRQSLEKVGIPFPEEKRRLSRQILTEMNVAQLQVIVNDLHTQIETLNESLVKFLMDRDDLHMEQDSMLVDIEDLTRYLGAKEQVLKEQNLNGPLQNNNIPPPSPAPSSPLAVLNSSVKPHLHRIASLVKK